MQTELQKWVDTFPRNPGHRDGSFKGAKAVEIVTKSVPDSIRDTLGNTAQNYIILGSAGKGDWTHTPWVALLDQSETTTVEEGIYVVYLLSYGGETLYLSINQGCTTLKNSAGLPKSRKELQRRAETARNRITKKAKALNQNEIDLNSNIWRANLYQHGNILARKYDAQNLPPDEVLEQDLIEALALYKIILSSGGTDADDKIIIEASTENENITLSEAKKYRYHRRIERNSSHSKKVKELQGTRCKGCNIDPQDVYGPLAIEMVDAHHLKPISKLADGQTIDLDPLKDFAVLCPNCHRLIHRMDNPGDLDTLRALIKKYRCQMGAKENLIN